MKLVKIDEMTYINADKVDLIVKNGSDRTRIYIGGRDQDYLVGLPIEKVVELLESSERETHSCMNVVDEKGFPENLNRVLHDIFDDRFGGSEK